jgi:hypothetical protein
MKMTAAVLTAVALLAAPAARAQPVSARSGPNTYLELDLGGFFPVAKDLDGLDANVAASGTFGAMFTPNVGAEASVGYYRASGTASLADRSLGVIPVLFNVRLVAPFKALELSARAGVGIHFASFHASGVGSFTSMDTAFGLQLGGSAAFNLSPTMLVGLDVLGTFAEASFDGRATRLDGVIVSVKLGYRL